MYNKEERKRLINYLKNNKNLLDHIDTPKASMVRIAINLIGLSNTSKLLNMRTKIGK